ncbi:trypco2 family protein [Roseobacter sp. CCS2]|uniref:trypco2 family protein n=1 Tax=Roseobacter sp. CCS2 TaxID=391593 RepID=UPI0000F3F572|nr:trypco2 family protein [Roseobacter sp. CCS2]EBA10808.1 hypothetical protein RCCS2_11397 [Roseobacter sp. CCS2]
MDLKEFISQTVSAIADATNELQEKYADDDIVINPPSALSGTDVFQPNSQNYTLRRVQNVQFDVAVTASSETSGGGKAEIKVWSMSLQGGADIAKNAEQVSRVAFSIPMTLKPSVHEATNLDEKKKNSEKANAPTPTQKMPMAGRR